MCAAGRGVSNGYNLPGSKQGMNDQRYFTAAKITSGWATERAARFKAGVLSLSAASKQPETANILSSHAHHHQETWCCCLICHLGVNSVALLT